MHSAAVNTAILLVSGQQCPPDSGVPSPGALLQSPSGLKRLEPLGAMVIKPRAKYS